MKKLATLFLAALILVGGYAAIAAGGSSSDPLISQSYITNTYIPSVVKQAGERIDSTTGKTYDDAATRLKAQADLHLAKAGALSGGGYAATFAEQRFKRGDILTVDTGSELMLLAGTATLAYDNGAVIDVTSGAVVPSGTAMANQRRYMAAENTVLRATITSDTAVLAPQGYYAVTPSSETDYNQLAAALKSMGLFKGTGTAYGSGYDLELAPTRIEGLVLFLRLVGEEKAALAYVGDCPFVDVPDWGRQYVSYAYYRGYTKGVDIDLKLFGSYNTISSGEYLTFVLRALGYQDSGTNPDFTWDTALARAQALGCITAGEAVLLGPAKPFLRAQVAYLSYYSLSANRKAGGSLQSYLISGGALSQSVVNTAQASVTVKRIA